MRKIGACIEFVFEFIIEFVFEVMEEFV